MEIGDKVSHGYGCHVHQLGERKDDDEQEAEEDMNLMGQRGMNDIVGGLGHKGEEPLSPTVEVHIVVEVAVDGLYGSQQSCDNLQEDEHHKEIVAEMTIGHDTTVGEAPQCQQTDSQEGDEPCTGTHDDSKLSFLLVGDEPIVGPLRSEQSENMTEEHKDDAYMEEIAAPLE